MRRTKEPKPIRLPYQQKKIKVFIQSQALFKIAEFENQINKWMEDNPVKILDMRFTASESIMYGFIYYKEL